MVLGAGGGVGRSEGRWECDGGGVRMRDLAGAARIDLAKGRCGVYGEPPACEELGGVGNLGDGDEERVACLDLV